MVRILLSEIRATKKNLSYIGSATFIQFLFYQLVFLSIMLCAKFIWKIYAVNNLSLNTLLERLTQPSFLGATLALGVLIFIGVAVELLILYELIYLKNRQARIRLAKIWQAFRKKKKTLFSPQFSLFIGYCLVVIPTFLLALSSHFLFLFKLPNFILDELTKSTLGSVLAGSVILIFCYLSLRWSLFLPLFLYEEEATIFQAFKESWRLTHKRVVEILLNVVVCFSLQTVGSAIFIWGMNALIHLVGQPITASFAGHLFIYSLVQLTLLWIQGCCQFWFCASLVTRFLGAHQQEADSQSESATSPQKLGLLFFLVLASACILLINGAEQAQLFTQQQTAIIAHRGDITKGVENTIPALIAAKKSGADRVEIDVQETKDHQVVVFHDKTLARLASQKVAVNQLTLSQLEKITVKTKRSQARIPSLQRYLQAAKKIKMPLLIDLKANQKNSLELAENVAKIIKQAGREQTDKLQTMNPQEVDLIKTQYPQLTIGYVVPLNLGNLPQTKADFIVLEDSSYTAKISRQAQVQKKELFIWTINKRKLLYKYLQADIQGLITDKIQLAKNIQVNIQERGLYYK